MDRLSVVIVALLLSSCQEKRDTPPDRVNAVKAKSKTMSTDGFCDYAPKSDSKFAWPKLATPPPAPVAGAWRWINVWATWCKPCVEELPRLAKWEADLKKGGRKLQLVFVSIDEGDDEVVAFRAKHKELTDGPRVADSKDLDAWYKTIGLDPGAPVPIHIWVDPENNVRCVRAGALREKDYASIEQVVAQ